MQAVPIRINEDARPGLPFHLASSGRYQMHVARRGTQRYTQACQVSADEYRTHFQCELRHFYPSYLCLERSGVLIAVCGYRSAAGCLFLEQYLDAPIEKLINERMDTQAKRENIVEIGGFAVRRRALALPFITALAPIFQQKGFSHAVCTATLPVRQCLKALSIPTAMLGKADPGRLRAGATDWGNYYRNRPAVIAGSIDATLVQLQESLGS